MRYSKILREHFDGINLVAEDLLLLESFQVKYLPERVPPKEFATLIRAYPFIRNNLVSKNPSIGDFITTVLKENEIIEDKNLKKKHIDELLWEIADLIVYNKFPETYDEKAKFNWNIDEIISKQSLAEKVVADVGAGSGMLAFLLSQYAETIYAIEPLSSFRTFIKQKAIKDNCRNVYAVDGFLDAIPFPGDFFDILFTSNAIGWNIERELEEIERVVKSNGQAIHLMRINKDVTENPVHEKLVSDDWKYAFSKTQDTDSFKLKYIKTIR